MKILVATTNQAKLAELIALIGDLDVEVQWLSLSDLPAVSEVVEDGRTFEQNARKKALGYAEATGCWTIADDSGLVIDALDGAPGVKSARFSGKKTPGENPESLDRRNIEKVLELMHAVPAEKRTARFVCSLSLAAPKEVLIHTEGILEGLIAETPSGSGGFGYDPIFFVPKLNKTVGQLTAEQKNAISHRANAIRKLKPILADLLSNPAI